MHPENAALYAKIDLYENVVKKARVVITEFLDMEGGRIESTPDSIQGLNTAIEEAANGKKKV
jgi:hypothetical protein